MKTPFFSLSIEGKLEIKKLCAHQLETLNPPQELHGTKTP
jgi:hypothetical protein